MNPTPQPVIKNAAASALALQCLVALAILTKHFGWWDPSSDDMFAIAQVVGMVFGVVLVVQGWLVHQRVTPVPPPSPVSPPTTFVVMPPNTTATANFASPPHATTVLPPHPKPPRKRPVKTQ